MGMELSRARALAIVSLALLIALVIIGLTHVPVDNSVEQTRVVNFLYNAQLYDRVVLGNDVGPSLVNVTNRDSTGGYFSVTMNWWYDYPNLLDTQKQKLQNTSSETSFISAGTTKTFYVPTSWYFTIGMYSFTYSVSVPTKLDSYNVTQTKYESVFTLLSPALGIGVVVGLAVSSTIVACLAAFLYRRERIAPREPSILDYRREQPNPNLCRMCGAQLNDGEVYCRKCGTVVSSS
jgi:hypothetical protein